MKIFIDYDSTMNNMSYAWIAWINKTYGTSFVCSDVTYWEWFQDIEQDAFKWFTDEIAFTEIQPLPQSQEFFDYLNSKYAVDILTHSHPNMVKLKNEHILEHYGASYVIHHKNKWDYAKDESTILIDDRPLNCIEWVKAGGIAFLFNHELNYVYSETEMEHRNLIKVNTYEQIVEKLKDM